MGYSEAKKKDLEAKNFHRLFEHRNHKPKWMVIAEKAYTYAKDAITEGREPLPDDISDALLPILNKDDDLRRHQKENRASSRKYKEAFADYIVHEFLIEKSRREQANVANAEQRQH
ncbi:MAG: hypothetical protein AUH11_03545 [Acidobacteria bacterium 13_2_20CM_57_17]|nr:MAG: hypothetical protein AUH11_03545 [Acidobacteria bacterium 13_2_20CM_57_17]OLB97896.1 MAG: hypothetical protein AUI02_00350 [Acidobacteria bacterium 13_2_20CM_2_57_12]HEU0048188.1 hypothetical protein [Nitrososphaera sp.]